MQSGICLSGTDSGLEVGCLGLAEETCSANKKRTVAQLRMASPKNHTQSNNRSIWKTSSTFDVPQHLPSPSLPKLLKHCLSSYHLATTVPRKQRSQKIFLFAANSLKRKEYFWFFFICLREAGFSVFENMM